MSFHKGKYRGWGNMWYRNLKQCAQKEYENYKYSFYDCFPQVCLVFNPISAICQIYPRDGEQAGPGPRAAAHRRPPPVFKAPVSVSGPSGGPSESPARLGARCSFSLVSIIIITQCQYLQFCVNVTETVSRYTVELATKFRVSWRGLLLGLSHLRIN